MLIALKSWDTVQQLHFIFFIIFNASVLQCALDAPIPTPNQSSRLTLPKQGATLRLLKIDRQIVKNNMEKLSPCHTEMYENCSKKSIETQWMNKFDKKHNKLLFSPGKTLSGILSTSKHLEHLFWRIKTIKQPIHCPMPSLRVISWWIRNGWLEAKWCNLRKTDFKNTPLKISPDFKL